MFYIAIHVEVGTLDFTLIYVKCLSVLSPQLYALKTTHDNLFVPTVKWQKTCTCSNHLQAKTVNRPLPFKRTLTKAGVLHHYTYIYSS